MSRGGRRSTWHLCLLLARARRVILYFLGGRRSGRIARQAALPGLYEFPGPGVAKAPDEARLDGIPSDMSCATVSALEEMIPMTNQIRVSFQNGPEL